MKKLFLGLCLVLAGCVANAATSTAGKAVTKVELVKTFEFAVADVPVITVIDNVIPNTTIIAKITSNDFSVVPEILRLEPRYERYYSWHRENPNYNYLPDQRKRIKHQIQDYDC